MYLLPWRSRASRDAEGLARLAEGLVGVGGAANQRVDAVEAELGHREATAQRHLGGEALPKRRAAAAAAILGRRALLFGRARRRAALFERRPPPRAHRRRGLRGGVVDLDDLERARKESARARPAAARRRPVSEKGVVCRGASASPRGVTAPSSSSEISPSISISPPPKSPLMKPTTDDIVPARESDRADERDCRFESARARCGCASSDAPASRCGSSDAEASNDMRTRRPSADGRRGRVDGGRVSERNEMARGRASSSARRDAKDSSPPQASPSPADGDGSKRSLRVSCVGGGDGESPTSADASCVAWSSSASGAARPKAPGIRSVESDAPKDGRRTRAASEPSSFGCGEGA